MLLPADSHAAFREAYHGSGSVSGTGGLWGRARGWALGQSLVSWPIPPTTPGGRR